MCCFFFVVVVVVVVVVVGVFSGKSYVQGTAPLPVFLYGYINFL